MSVTREWVIGARGLSALPVSSRDARSFCRRECALRMESLATWVLVSFFPE